MSKLSYFARCYHTQLCAKTFVCLTAKDGVFQGIRSGKLQKHQITYRIDDGLQHENPLGSILTPSEFVKQKFSMHTNINLNNFMIYS